MLSQSGTPAFAGVTPMNKNDKAEGYPRAFTSSLCRCKSGSV